MWRNCSEYDVITESPAYSAVTTRFQWHFFIAPKWPHIFKNYVWLEWDLLTVWHFPLVPKVFTVSGEVWTEKRAWFLTMLFPPTKVSGASDFRPKSVKSLARGSASAQPSSILRRRSVEMRSSRRPLSMRTTLAALPVWYRSRSLTLPLCHLQYETDLNTHNIVYKEQRENLYRWVPKILPKSV